MEMRQQFMYFIVRWVLNILGLWVSARLISSIEYDGTFAPLLLAGLMLSLINIVLKPILVILSLPFLIVTLGLFMLLVNGVLVFFAVGLVPGISMGFSSAILAGLIIGLINYVLTRLIDVNRKQ